MMGLVVAFPSSSTWVMMGPDFHTSQGYNKPYKNEASDVLGEGVRHYRLRVPKVR
jgi:hypothetical protein